MSCEEETYPAASKDLHGGNVYTRDKAALSTSQVQVTVLASGDTPDVSTTWHVPDLATQVNTYTVKAMALVGPGTNFVLTAGRYRVWYLVTDAPEESMIGDQSTFRIV